LSFEGFTGVKSILPAMESKFTSLQMQVKNAGILDVSDNPESKLTSLQMQVKNAGIYFL